MAKHTIKIQSGSVEALDFLLDEMVKDGLVYTCDYRFVEGGEKTEITFFYDSARKEEFQKFLRLYIFKTEEEAPNIIGEIVAAVGCFSIPFLGVFLVGLLA
jgi:hypothetical protein